MSNLLLAHVDGGEEIKSVNSKVFLIFQIMLKQSNMIKRLEASMEDIK